MSLPNAKVRQAHFVAHYARDSGGIMKVAYFIQMSKTLWVFYAFRSRGTRNELILENIECLIYLTDNMLFIYCVVTHCQ